MRRTFFIFCGFMSFVLLSCNPTPIAPSTLSIPVIEAIEVLPKNTVPGSWQMIRLRLAGGADDFQGTFVAYQVDPRVNGKSFPVAGESYLFPIEVPKGTKKNIEFKLPSRNWRALGLNLRIGTKEYELGPHLEAFYQSQKKLFSFQWENGYQEMLTNKTFPEPLRAEISQRFPSEELKKDFLSQKLYVSVKEKDKVWMCVSPKTDLFWLLVHESDNTLGIYEYLSRDCIELAKPSTLNQVCWIVSKPSVSKNFLYTALRENEYQIEEIGANQLPHSWIAYQSLDLLVLVDESLESIDPQQAKALKTFANAGGRIVSFSGANSAMVFNSVLSEIPTAGDLSTFPSGLKKFVGYTLDSEAHHYLKPRQSSLTLLTPDQSNFATSSTAQKLAPEVPQKSFILLLLGGFFLVALVGNRFFCSRFLRKPEMTYPIFLVCSLLYFVGVYYLGWQVEDRSIKHLELSFVYVPPTGDQMVAHTSEAVISGMAQSLQNVKLDPESFIYPQSIEDVDTYGYGRRPSLGSTASGEFENLSGGVIRNAYLRPNAISGFMVERIVPKTLDFQPVFKSFIYDVEKGYGSSSSYDPYAYSHYREPTPLNDVLIELVLNTSEQLENLEFVLVYKDRYFLEPKSSVLAPKKYLLTFERSKIPSSNPYPYSYRPDANSFDGYLMEILGTHRKQYFEERESVTKLIGISFNEHHQTELNQGKIPTELMRSLSKKCNLNFSEQEIRVDKESSFEWVMTLKNRKTEKSETFLIKRDLNQMLNVHHKRILETDPVCRLFIVEKTPKHFLPDIKALGTLARPQNRQYNASIWYPVIYVVPVEVPKENWK